MKSWQSVEGASVGILGNLAFAVLGIILLLLLLALLAIEIQYRRRPGNKLDLISGDWKLEVLEPQFCRFICKLEFLNRTQKLEIMVPELSAEVRLLSGGSLDDVLTTVQIMPRSPDAAVRADGYWEGYIVKRKPFPIELSIEIKGPDLSQLKAAWLQIHFIRYGPAGRIPDTRHLVVPLAFPDPEASRQNWRSATGADVLPIRTHLLTPLDHPVEVVKRYVLPHAQPGDVVTIGESPIAIMQGRFRHPSTIKPGWVARRLCYLFLPTSSLATACGLQTLVDIVGPTRVLFAFLVGAIAKILGKPGVFYQLAGEQARLIDDVTGTLPPYDKFIVLGPEQPQQVVDQIKRETGLAAAIVDVNDLRAVKVLAASPEIPLKLLEQALIKNPAGNANEQTPIVLIRAAK
jgi:hypothetical protein